MQRRALTSEAQPSSDAPSTRELAVNEYDTHIRTASNPLSDDSPSISDSISALPVASFKRQENQWTTGLCDWCAPPQGQGLCTSRPATRHSL